jgi:Domain of unknown function (DUF397)
VDLLSTMLPAQERAWLRSSHCASNSCVEIARIGDSIGVRDSKDVTQGQQSYDAQAWRDFTTSVKNGRYDF